VRRSRAGSGALGRLDLCALLCLSAAGCMTSHAYERAQSFGEGDMTLPKSSDSFSAPSYPSESASVHFLWNWPAFVLLLPVTLAWDAVTLPVQWAGGFHPYGKRWEPG